MPTSRAAPAPTSPSSSTREPEGPGRRRDGAPGRLAGRRRGCARLLGAAAARRGRRDRARAGRLRFEDPEGLGLELAVVETDDRPLISHHPDIPDEVALQGFDGVRAYTRDAPQAVAFVDSLGFQTPDGETYEVRGEERGSFYAYDRTDGARLPGAGTSTTSPGRRPSRITRPGGTVMAGGAMPTPVIDRFYFKSIYFREPSGVLFEIATIGPGFTSDEPLESLGERLSLPPNFEQYREQVERTLTLPDPWAKTPVS